MLTRCIAIILVGILGSAVLGTAPAEAMTDIHTEFIAAKSCGFEFTYSRPSVYAPKITGNGVAQCDGPPEEHILTLALEYQQGGRWVNAAHITDAAIPPAPPKSRTYEVSAACYAGTWRVSMSVTGRIQGNPFVFSDHSRTRDVSTSQCPSR
ncbi:hypothetical protein IU427_06180 [Nocardia beijingensis]|uniref:hypothetical protein n=1 Tax=Nocardia beijingensis TaxID=95162 RepID=UPI001893CFC8|nr:hypothetical protein [Nocardia beijingensis]MBF6464772.1 hypothetical protein [Nocardia beijingensis]